jgi:diguanylate cyclase (GGDEF)-like protein/putative nucleotidyltransferase with HDIG domain
MPHQHADTAPAPLSTLREEARETSGLTSAMLLDYLERTGGRPAVAEVLRRTGLERCEAELRDENSWFSWETKIALFEATAEVLDDPDFLSGLAAHALDSNVAGGLKVALRTLGSPQLVFRNIVRANARFVRSHVLEVLELSEGHAVLRFATIGEPPRAHRLDCDYAVGLLAIIPELFGLPKARVSHAQCAAEGADACVFELHWVDRARIAARVALGGAALGVMALSALLLPVAVPFAGVGVAAVGGLLVRERSRHHRDQWRHLQRQVEDSEEVAQRLFASLQDLVSDLRLEEVIAKVARNAQAAVGGRDFLLLVRDGDRLSCQGSIGLPPDGVAAVEAWANAAPRALETSLLIDDVNSLPALCPLARLENPLCSLASAPLNRAGESFGLLVALGGQQQTFLPRDVTVLESYAAQVAIALSNARLYQNERSLAARDPLTGLLNHRSFHDAMDGEIERCVQEQFHSSVVLIDLDNFKQINDQDGHAAGDRLLRAAALALSDACRREDLAFRIGGDEFALLLPRLTEGEANTVASRACDAIAALDPRLGASAGVAAISVAGSEKNAVLGEADRRLYAVKHGESPSGVRRRPASRSSTTAETVDVLTGALELHHPATAAHSAAVSELAAAVAGRLGCEAGTRELAVRTALMHDLGKLATARDLLDKPGRLTEDEWVELRRHPDDGARLLARAGAPERLAQAVRASREHFDGGGYPDGLAADAIPLAARIVAVCDAFDAMSRERPYRPARSDGETLAELQAAAGSQFDPAVVAALTAELQLGAARHLGRGAGRARPPGCRPRHSLI